MTIVDGNALAGDLGEVLGVDATSARLRCSGCDTTGRLAVTRVYRTAMGSVARCRGCDTVLVTVVDAGAQHWVALPGARAVAND
ncbi:hypothetical protein DEJ16_09465 [Curtobacterium sp. MCJR17_055]|uniref:DUF6510 family protein n=1 Tax=unclassified Curtobacterium TaxID=257496 RepID=UPI000D9DD21B|nr:MULTISPECIES: DUF6510 family protein [unclassified Curtobacterium]PYY32689.1 hypothetical protein DEI87_14050 [Curtobacterium sp. MCBD17_029]PYY42461.1 hypothetical protein DEJ32_03175 [Curtobacterium sp. MCPF17_046]PYY50977.1 hypothetical protein DEI84_04195 [Curtobacterium sp. MCBD17_023]PYY55713.1 hypothetical protein DEJ16_09465 [Curtobacterium sp. MCJR17_055]PYY60458.1 hypothetical protein DEJ26_06585 [Curtobacterium sp. MCPF17_015]